MLQIRKWERYSEDVEKRSYLWIQTFNFCFPSDKLTRQKAANKKCLNVFVLWSQVSLAKHSKRGRYKPLRQCTRQILCLYTRQRTVTWITEVQDYDRDTMSHLSNGNWYLIYTSLVNTCRVSSFHGNYGRTCPRVLNVDRHNSEGIHNVLL